ncbi:MAG TPA: 16S rRNA (adenine(1518)-N(6)/adenine(1519)-N(6))-dimethyltransferase RsmA [Vicinamibacterales bacterium]|nr:16S rRNA (adenine(1518)-N(6)/adenine(1519)-N(6))-dimethyltransferase RsmA [Vicinamibacterales bacterium]
MKRSRPPARRRFGQHFLAAAWARKVVQAIAPEPGDVFLEIGPGHGALTMPLAESGAPILAIEIDRDLVAQLAPKLPPNVTLLTGDVLTANVISFLRGLDPQRPPAMAAGPAPPRRYRVAGNLPYNVATPILFRLIELHRHQPFFVDATVMVQKEVGDRLAAKPGRKEYGALSILAQLHCRIERLLELPPGAFSPPPKVRSSVVRLTFTPPAVRVADDLLFDQIVKALFSQRRKTLLNALKRYDPLGPAVLQISGLDGRRRPETLQVAEIARLVELFAAARRPAVL